MKIERVTLKGFRCFGSEGATIELDDGVTALVGANGAGKTALLQALSRLFGVTASQRHAAARDFHLPADRQELQSGDHFSVDVVLSFPEMAGADADKVDDAVPEFFLQMMASGPGEPLTARIMLLATWTDDGTPGGNLDEDVRWIPTLDNNYEWDQCQKVQAVQRGTIQLVYVPATRNVHEQVTALLKGRLWQAAKWSEEFRQSSIDSAQEIQETFQNEDPAKFVLERLEARWKQVHEADTDTKPMLRLVESRFEEFVRRADFAFYPDEAGQERALGDLSDGQRSLFHMALTAATLEVERDAFGLPHDESAFDLERLRRVHLTLLAIEEPENSLSPFFLSRIIAQARDIGDLDSAQVILSSHSAAILSRIEPEEVRYFRLDRATRTSAIRELTLPADDEEASRYVRLAVRAYPELYFARFVILGEGDSEQLVIPRIAEAIGVALDPSFVPIVPLGGRHVAHFWRLLTDLKIPYATLLDLDMGRAHGGANMVRSVNNKLTEVGRGLDGTMAALLGDIDVAAIGNLEDEDIWIDYENNNWLRAMEEQGVFFSDPLDLDFSMLESFPDAYQLPNPGGTGPRASNEALASAKKATLKTEGDDTLYRDAYDDEFRWYPYLFLNRSKPETHISALTRISDEDLANGAPAPIKALIKHVKDKLGLGDEGG
jgi:predicted ATPase